MLPTHKTIYFDSTLINNTYNHEIKNFLNQPDLILWRKFRHETFQLIDLILHDSMIRNLVIINWIDFV